MGLKAYVTIVLQIFDALVRRVFAVDVDGHADSFNARDIHDWTKICSPLNLCAGAKIKDFRDAEVPNLSNTFRCHSARVGRTKDTTRSDRTEWAVEGLVSADITEVEYTIDGNEG